MSRRAPITILLHRVLLALLMLGACLQPAMAAVCDIEDLRVATPASHDAMAAANERTPATAATAAPIPLATTAACMPPHSRRKRCG